MDIATPPCRDWLVQRRAEASDLPYLVYCSNCRDIFAAAGKPVLHALELFEGCGRETPKAPGIERRLLNRRAVKEAVVERYFPRRDASPPAAEPPPLRLAEGLAEKLDRERIFLANVSEVIVSCEAARRRLRNAAGHYVGHCEIGYMTYWAEYLPEDGGYTVFNAYAHRMKIEEGRPHG